MDRIRNCCITWNNYPANYMVHIHSLPKRSYLVVGKEVAPVTGTPHLQIYIEFKSAVTLKRIHKSCPTVHVEKRKGSALQASVYCKKDEDFVEEGEISKQGKRNDIDAVREILETGGIREVVDQCSSYTALRFAECHLKIKERERNFQPYIVWLYGDTDLGKTRSAHIDAWRLGFGGDTYLISDNGKWWDGYDAHKAVILDDIRPSFCDFVRMLNITDRYACRVECKGGSRQLLAEVIYITAPVHPREMWSTHEKIEQLLRRIHVIQEIKYDGSVTHKGNAIPTEIPEDYDETTLVSQAVQDRIKSCQEVRETSDA